MATIKLKFCQMSLQSGANVSMEHFGGGRMLYAITMLPSSIYTGCSKKITLYTDQRTDRQSDRAINPQQPAG